MTALPIIVGMGGINAAGRTSFHQGYRRIILDKLDDAAREETFLGLATLMNLVSFKDGQLVSQDGEAVSVGEIEEKFGQQIIDGTLIRKIEKNHFDVDATHWQQKLTVTANSSEGIAFTCRKRDLPSPVPSSWVVEEIEPKMVSVRVPEQE